MTWCAEIKAVPGFLSSSSTFSAVFWGKSDWVISGSSILCIARIWMKKWRKGTYLLCFLFFKSVSYTTAGPSWNSSLPFILPIKSKLSLLSLNIWSFWILICSSILSRANSVSEYFRASSSIILVFYMNFNWMLPSRWSCFRSTSGGHTFGAVFSFFKWLGNFTFRDLKICLFLNYASELSSFSSWEIFSLSILIATLNLEFSSTRLFSV